MFFFFFGAVLGGQRQELLCQAMGERLLQHPGNWTPEKRMGRSKEQMSENTRCGYTLHGYNIMTQCIIITMLYYYYWIYYYYHLLLYTILYCYTRGQGLDKSLCQPMELLRFRRTRPSSTARHIGSLELGMLSPCHLLSDNPWYRSTRLRSLGCWAARYFQSLACCHPFHLTLKPLSYEPVVPISFPKNHRKIKDNTRNR